MTLLILGLILFLAPHSVRIVADAWRGAQVARIGLPAWKGLYSAVSIVGLALIVWGYGIARTAPIDVWNPPVFTRHLASLFTLAAFVLLVAAYVPRNRIKAAIGHPMVAGVKLWAFAHLLANGTVADLLLFGSFLVWAILDFRSARRRDRSVGAARAGVSLDASPSLAADVVVVLVGIGVWALFAFQLHGWLFGVRPFG
ncbi:NnrU family protein [Zeimonas arvi]|uniref:NnrU domain-containing protein n=1 Tax=Zeimonas arvi TaxID=2498847 RepID=A0A5C8NUA0_9BURK|nr:NnrU family protein [Zeimonas arvi]TXL64744.1 hypothetical protein FHP08_13465 [Zeimonas arvi]